MLLGVALVKVFYSDVSIIQMFVIQIPTVLFFFRASKAMYKAKEQQYKCRSYKIFLPMLLQTPVWIFTTVAIRNLVLQRSDSGSADSIQRLAELSSEGCLWFQNLVNNNFYSCCA